MISIFKIIKLKKFLIFYLKFLQKMALNQNFQPSKKPQKKSLPRHFLHFYCVVRIIFEKLLKMFKHIDVDFPLSMLMRNWKFHNALVRLIHESLLSFPFYLFCMKSATQTWEIGRNSSFPFFPTLNEETFFLLFFRIRRKSLFGIGSSFGISQVDAKKFLRYEKIRADSGKILYLARKLFFERKNLFKYT